MVVINHNPLSLLDSLKDHWQIYALIGGKYWTLIDTPRLLKAPKLASNSVSEIRDYFCPAMRRDEATSLGILSADKTSEQIDLLELDSPASM